MTMNSASVAAEGLPDDLAMAILLKLPVKSLIRFRCLSKSTSAAIRSARFVERHHSLQRQNSNPQILVKVFPRHVDYGEKPYLTAISGELLRTENIRMLCSDVSGPCNGLICFRNGKEHIAIWNPATREFKYIPRFTIPRHRWEVDIAAVSLGFDSRSGEYKVIALLINYYGGEGGWTDRVQLYSLSSNSWREIHVPVMRFDEFSTFYDQKNDRVLWLGFGENQYQMILPFSMRNESFSSIPLPEFEGYPKLVFVEDPGADIALIAYPANQQEISFDLWVKKEAWTREWRIGPFQGIHHPLGLWKFGQMLLVSDHSEMLLMNVESGEIKNLGVFEVAIDWQIVVFMESLVPILGCTEKEKEREREKEKEKKYKRSSSSSFSNEINVCIGVSRNSGSLHIPVHQVRTPGNFGS